MTVEEKLKHFEEICTDDAKKQYDKMIFDYTASLEKIFQEHKQNTVHQADLRVAAETEKIHRDSNRELSLGQIDIKRSLSQKQEELKGKIFTELRDELAKFMETPEYSRMLEAQIRKAKEFAGTDEVHFYIDPSDKNKQNLLSMHTDCDIRISEYSFLGGTRAVISSRNILIDNSFETKLKEEEENFQFLLGGK